MNPPDKQIDWTDFSNPDGTMITGVVKRVVYRNPENEYTVLMVKSEESDKAMITVVGFISHLPIGAHIVAKGEYKSHPKFGHQFVAESLAESKPTDEAGITRYLGSGLVKGVGEKTAERIVKHFGESTLEVLEQTPDRIKEVSGIGDQKAKIISNAFAAQKESKETMRYLLDHELSVGLARKIWNILKKQTIEIVSKHPYKLISAISGIGFKTADAIALKIGIEPDSPQRIKAGITYALTTVAERSGHCYLLAEELVRHTADLLNIDDIARIEHSLDSLYDEGNIIIEEDRCYLPSFHSAECFVAMFAKDRAQGRETISESTIHSALTSLEARNKFKYSEEQKQAVINATKYPFFIITGGPGCGKTTVVRAVKEVFAQAGKSIRLAAPTGRAAQRLAQVCDMEASTVHRMLRYDPGTKSFIHSVHDPIPSDVVIVDEASMIDINLAKSLTASIDPGATLILVGDKDQLPSVGPGKFLADLIESKSVCTAQLTYVYRRGEESSINTVAQSIISGQIPDIPVPDGTVKSDTYFVKKNTPEEIAAVATSLVADQIPKKFGIPTEDIVVLSPMNKGAAGIIALNNQLQAKLNSEDTNAPEIVINQNTPKQAILRQNDKVCQRVNNYNIDSHGVFNGDTGRLNYVDPGSKKAILELWDGRLITYTDKDLEQLSLAYALTIHRSQGSEIPCVVLCLHDSHYNLLDKHLIYTAVTRAKKLLILVGTDKALRYACSRAQSSDRNTTLAQRITS